MHQLFGYGTLRKGGISHFLLGGAKVLREGVWQSSHSMYSACWYPFAIFDPTGKILGDIVKVPDVQWPALDAYEGDAYERVLLEEEGVWLYHFPGSPEVLLK